MKGSLRHGAAVVAVLVFAVTACGRQPGSPSVVSESTSTPAPTVSQVLEPQTPPAPTAVAPWWLLGMRELCGYSPHEYGCVGELPSGTHRSGSLDPAVTYTVPSGWINYADWPAYFALLPDTPATRAGLSTYRYVRSIVVITDDVRVASSDCQPGVTEGGASASEIAAALGAREGLETTGPTSVTVGRLVGLQLDVGLEPGWTETCPQDPTIPAAPIVANEKAQGDGRHRLILLDEPDGGNIAIVLYADHAADFEPFLATAMPIVDSIEFAP